MAVAIKNTPELASPGLLDRMAVASLAGTAYALGALGVVVYLLPSLWWGMWAERSFVALTLLGLVQLAAVVGLCFFGARLLGPRAPQGVRAGIGVGLLGFFTILLLTRWASLWLEHWTYDQGLMSPAAGALLTAVAGVALLASGILLFMRTGTEKFLVQLEGQGWFSATAYKPLQGLRVRRGTIFGILLLVGAGVYTLLSHGTLRKGSPDWQLDIPFTGQVVITYPGDAADTIKQKFSDWQEGTPLTVDRQTFAEINKTVDPATHVKIKEPGASEDFSPNQIVERSRYDEEVKKLKASGQGSFLPKIEPPQPASGALKYAALPLLPSVQFTVPLLLLAASLWLAYRIVNVPAFADFLIATDAEMNKVSWTTQRRLVQDTIVVLVTVLLMAFYLFAMDQTWRVLLSWKPIGVLILPSEEQQETSQNVEQRPW
jgi:preprotein translocase SecE subunit